MSEIAAAAGVSATTVSHTLSGKRPVNPETAARIRRIVDEISYKPNAGAVQLASGRSSMIGLAVPDISNWFYGLMAKGVEEAASEEGYGVLVCSPTAADEGRYLRMLQSRIVDGLIYAAGREISDRDPVARVRRSEPLILADELIPSLPDLLAVSADHQAGGRLMAEHVAMLGHRDVVVLAGHAALQSTLDRLQGIYATYPNVLSLHGDFEIQSGRDLVGRLIENRVPFTALLCLSDVTAIGAMAELQTRGIAVPGDVSVVGFDDADISSLVTPALTTVHQDVLGIGRSAAQLLISGILNGRFDGLRSMVSDVHLVVRNSTGPATGPAVPESRR